MKTESRSDSLPIRPTMALPLAAWTIAVVVMSVLVWFRPHAHTVYIYYAEAGRNWTQGICSYEHEGIVYSFGYRYCPTITVLCALLGHLSDAVGGILWRWLGVALVVTGFGYACRTIHTHWADTSPTERQWLWLLILPLCIANLHNGQANLHLLGLMLIGVAAVQSGRWNLAAVCLAAASLLKIYPVSLALLLIAIYPWRLGPRFAIALAVGAALPFLAQSTDYVLSEYRTWFSIMVEDDRFGTGCTLYRDLAQLLYLAHVPITRAQYLIIEVAAGAAAAAVCLIARWRLGWSAERVVPLAYALGTFWMLLCGPTTESSTYILVAPLAAWLVLDAIHGRMPLLCRVLVIAGSVLVHAALFSSIFPFVRTVHNLGLQPFGVLVMATGYLIDRFGPAYAGSGSARIAPAAWEHSR